MAEVDALVEYELDGSVPKRGDIGFAPEEEDPDAGNDAEADDVE